MGFLVVSKNEDTIKNKSTRVVTTLFIDFSDTQGQLTLRYVMESCGNSKRWKLLWRFLLSARILKIHPKMKALELSQHFSHCKSMGIFQMLKGSQLISPW